MFSKLYKAAWLLFIVTQHITPWYLDSTNTLFLNIYIIVFYEGAKTRIYLFIGYKCRHTIQEDRFQGINCCSFVLHHLPEFAQICVHWVSDAIQPSHPLSSPSPPTFNLSPHQGLFSVSVLRIRWPKYWSFSFNISPSSEHSGLISFRMDWLDLHAV